MKTASHQVKGQCDAVRRRKSPTGLFYHIDWVYCTHLGFLLAIASSIKKPTVRKLSAMKSVRMKIPLNKLTEKKHDNRDIYCSSS